MRIVGGRFAGRDLVSPRDFRVRPTAEPVRAALLDRLAADLPGARVLDLFAGTGALGLEAISRGAATADFVEFRPASLAALKANVSRLALKERVRIFRKDVFLFLAGIPEREDRLPYDLVFADPPYRTGLLDRVHALWREGRLSPILAVEHARDHQLPGGTWRKVFEETAVTIYRLRKTRFPGSPVPHMGDDHVQTNAAAPHHPGGNRRTRRRPRP